MRIGFTGAGGTGKSTTLDLVAPSLDVPVLRSGTRAVMQRWGITEADQDAMTPADRLRLQLEIFDARRQAEREHPEFISDRTLLDNYAYCMFRNCMEIGNAQARELSDEVASNMSRYQLIFYFPITFEPPSDGLRQGGLAYNMVINSLILSFLDRHVVGRVRGGNMPEVVHVPPGPPEIRAHYVKSSIAYYRETNG